jgi:hypothetical protein
MFKKIALGLVALIALVLLYATTQPATFKVERSATVKAPPDKIYPLIADFHRWAEWSPWEHLDPAMKRTFSGASADLGAIYTWKGNSDVGEGRMEVTGSTPPAAGASGPLKVAIKLDFIEPIEGHNITDFIITPAGESSTVQWVMTGPMPYLSKLMTVFVSMDKLIGKDFDAGLTKLKAVAEK